MTEIKPEPLKKKTICGVVAGVDAGEALSELEGSKADVSKYPKLWYYREKDVRAAVMWLSNDITNRKCTGPKRYAEGYNTAMNDCFNKIREAFPDVFDEVKES